MSKNDQSVTSDVTNEESQVGKGRPTPSRKQSQAANANPIAGARDKSVRKAQRAQANAAREKARLGMLAGDERFLGPRDKGPQRRYVRDYVDARLSFGEFLIPIMLLVLASAMLPTQAQVYILLGIWVYLFISIVDAVILGMVLKRKLAAKFGADKVQPGYKWYAAMRAMQFRMLRVPKPQVKRFQYPE